MKEADISLKWIFNTLLGSEARGPGRGQITRAW